MSGFADRILSLFFPHRCAFCGKAISSGQIICNDCVKALPYVSGKTCPRCGRGTEYCKCAGDRFEFDRCISPFYYAGIVRRSIISYKFHAKQASAAAYAAITAEKIKKEYGGMRFDYVTSVPLSASEFKKRGFNQSEIFARALAENLELPYRNVLFKPNDVKPQRTLNSAERKKNVSGAFCAKEKEETTAVLLVDDIITTGSTLSDCARALKSAGVKTVFCAAIACVVPNFPETFQTQKKYDKIN
jgi:ComF family protein